MAIQNLWMSLISDFLACLTDFHDPVGIDLTLLLFVTISFGCCRYFLSMSLVAIYPGRTLKLNCKFATTYDSIILTCCYSKYFV